MDYFADRNFGNNSYDFHNEKKISISEDRRINSTVRWGIRFMLVNKMLLNVIAILLVIFAIFLFSYYFSMFFTRRKKKIAIVIGYIIFVVWQLLLLNARACLKIKNCTKHLFLSPFYSIIKKKGCSLC